MNKLNPRQKKIALALAGAGALALIALLSRDRSAGPAAAATDPGEGQPPPFGSTFADNGEAAGGLSTSITTGLGDVALGLEDVRASNAGVVDALAELRLNPPERVITQVERVEVPTVMSEAPAAALAAAAVPAGQQLAATRKAGVFTQSRGARTGLNYVVKGNTRLYESAPGRGDWGKKAGTRIARPKPAPPPKPPAKAKSKAKPKPEAAAKPPVRPKAAPKAKAAPAPAARQPAPRPSKAPAHKPKPPARRKPR